MKKKIFFRQSQMHLPQKSWQWTVRKYVLEFGIQQEVKGKVNQDDRMKTIYLLRKYWSIFLWFFETVDTSSKTIHVD